MKKNERSPAGTDVWNCLWGSVADFISILPSNKLYWEWDPDIQNVDGRDCPGEITQKDM